MPIMKIETIIGDEQQQKENCDISDLLFGFMTAQVAWFLFLKSRKSELANECPAAAWVVPYRFESCRTKKQKK
jgi:hypothetical protein